MTKPLVAVALAVVVMARVGSARADETPPPVDENRLARTAQNPVAQMSSIPIQNEVDFGIGPLNRVRNTLSLLPTVGIALTHDVGIVSRTRLPVVSQPIVAREGGYTSGLGDVTEALYLVPHATKDVVWGVGPSLLLPTATPRELGADQLGIGPTAAIIVQPRPFTFGALAAQTWGVLGPANRPGINQLNMMPLVAYQLPSGWYLTTSPVITANFNADTAANTWTVPVGGGGGKVIVVDDVPVNVQVSAYWNAIRPNTVGTPSGTAQLQVALLLP